MENCRARGRNVVDRELSLGDRIAVEEVTAVPRDRDFKKLVRRRMHKTGESFTAARAQLLTLRDARTLASHPGGTGMYPFDRFTEPAKEALTLAQQEAEASGAGYIGTEHLLLGLLNSGGAAAMALEQLDVERQPVREAISSHVGPEEPHMAGRVMPANRVKKVIELAFGEAGTSHVGTEHLLFGILREGSGLGAQVLAQSGVTLDLASKAVSAVLAEGQPKAMRRAIGSSTGMPSTSGVYQAIEGARRSAVKEGAMLLRSDHLLGALVQRDSPAPALLTLLAATGTNLLALRRRLKPPRKITQLEAEIWRLRLQKEEAIAAGDKQASAGLRQRERELREQLAAALDAWQAGWDKAVAEPAG